jgi:hypothetical protein
MKQGSQGQDLMKEREKLIEIKRKESCWEKQEIDSLLSRPQWVKVYTNLVLFKERQHGVRRC